MLQSSWKVSFVAFLRDLSGKDWNPRQDKSLKGWKVVLKKKTFSNIATKFQAGFIFIWLVFCIISLHCRHAHLLECGFVKFNRWVFPRRAALFKWTTKKIQFCSIFMKVKQKNFEIMHSFWTKVRMVIQTLAASHIHRSSSSFPNFQPLLDQLLFPELFHPSAHFSLTFHDDLEINVPFFGRSGVFSPAFLSPCCFN